MNEGRGWYYGRRSNSYDGPIYVESRAEAGSELLGSEIAGPFTSHDAAESDAEAWLDGLTTVEIEVTR